MQNSSSTTRTSPCLIRGLRFIGLWLAGLWLLVFAQRYALHTTLVLQPEFKNAFDSLEAGVAALQGMNNPNTWRLQLILAANMPLPNSTTITSSLSYLWFCWWAILTSIAWLAWLLTIWGSSQRRPKRVASPIAIWLGVLILWALLPMVLILFNQSLRPNNLLLFWARTGMLSLSTIIWNLGFVLLMAFSTHIGWQRATYRALTKPHRLLWKLSLFATTAWIATFGLWWQAREAPILDLNYSPQTNRILFVLQLSVPAFISLLWPFVVEYITLFALARLYLRNQLASVVVATAHPLAATPGTPSPGSAVDPNPPSAPKRAPFPWHKLGTLINHELETRQWHNDAFKLAGVMDNVQAIAFLRQEESFTDDLIALIIKDQQGVHCQMYRHPLISPQDQTPSIATPSLPTKRMPLPELNHADAIGACSLQVIDKAIYLMVAWVETNENYKPFNENYKPFKKSYRLDLEAGTLTENEYYSTKFPLFFDSYFFQPDGSLGIVDYRDTQSLASLTVSILTESSLKPLRIKFDQSCVRNAAVANEPIKHMIAYIDKHQGLLALNRQSSVIIAKYHHDSSHTDQATATGCKRLAEADFVAFDNQGALLTFTKDGTLIRNTIASPS